MIETIYWYFMENEDRLTNPCNTLWECMGEAYYALGADPGNFEPTDRFMFQRAHYMEMNFRINAFDCFLDQNEEQDFEGEAYIGPAVAEELDRLVAESIRDWFIRNNLRQEFRSMETAGLPVLRPWCDLALTTIGKDTMS